MSICVYIIIILQLFLVANNFIVAFIDLLCSPCVQKTTVKQKAEAFEKLSSPVAVRETRTRTRQLTTDDADVSSNIVPFSLICGNMNPNEMENHSWFCCRSSLSRIILQRPHPPRICEPIRHRVWPNQAANIHRPVHCKRH